ncbi:uncharacterized protein LOC119662936, partial [Teleopsis dalmanni]|uniref:uncharacterized protein LOC119662936 n=1 Tax=Teleopsis dalmanni TaxID=139649 RepID=UPI0018CFD389
QNISWNIILNLIIQKYVYDNTLCVIWNKDFDFQLELQQTEVNAIYALISLTRSEESESFEYDVVDHNIKRNELKDNGIHFDNFVEKLTISIEYSHCENFLIFQSDIPIFVEAFTNASKFSIWHSMNNKFIFAYNNDSENQPNILLIEGSENDRNNFYLKTNKYVGKRADGPSQMYILDYFNAETEVFKYNIDLFPNKIKDLQGREIKLSALSYAPSIIIKPQQNSTDRMEELISEDNAPTLSYLDGTEGRIVSAFCEVYNCTMEIDDSEDDWGMLYPNMTGYGALGLISNKNAEISVGAMYSWYTAYRCADISMYLVRSGITCVVPAPVRLASWLLPIQPFQASLWLAVFICLSIETLGLLMTRRIEQYLIDQNKSWIQSLKFSYITTLKLFISQSGSSQVTTISVRVLLFACFLNDLIITSIYGGGLASILTVPSFGGAADTLERLQSMRLKWAADSEAWVLSLRNSDDERVRDILKNFHIYTDEELTQFALEGKIGITVERLPFGHYAAGDYLSSSAIDHLKIMLDDIYFEYTVAFVTRVWPLLDNFNKVIYMWHSSGLDKFWEWRIVADNMDDDVQKRIKASMNSYSEADLGPLKLGMSNFAGILLIWVLGILIAILAFICEVIKYRSEMKKDVEEKFECN